MVFTDKDRRKLDRTLLCAMKSNQGIEAIKAMIVKGLEGIEKKTKAMQETIDKLQRENEELRTRAMMINESGELPRFPIRLPRGIEDQVDFERMGMRPPK